MNLIEALSNLKRYESHEIDGFGTINILKPTLAQIQSFEDMAKAMDENAGIEIMIKHVEKIGLEFIVDENGSAIFTKDNIESLKTAPAEILMEIIAAFKKTFDKINVKAEDLEKKHSAQK